jgi:HEAT repeat protein
MGLLGRLFGPKIDKLKQRGDVEGLAAVITSDGKTEDRIAAIDALVELGDDSTARTLVTILGDADGTVDQAAEKAIRGLGNAASGALVGGLAQPIGDRALGLLLELGDVGADALQEAAQNDDETTRLHALSGLLALADSTDTDATRDQCFRAVLATLGDKTPSCRAAAASGLAAFGEARAAKALAAQLKDGDETVRSACQNTLSDIGSPAVPYLVDAVVDRNPNSKQLAAALLAEVDFDPVEVQDRQAALRVLVGLQHSKNDELAASAAAAVRRIPAADVIENHLERLEDPTSDEREETEAFVRQILEHGAMDSKARAAAERRLDAITPTEPEHY